MSAQSSWGEVRIRAFGAPPADITETSPEPIANSAINQISHGESSDDITAPRCDWVSSSWGACIREPKHAGLKHVVIDDNGDLIHVAKGTWRDRPHLFEVSYETHMYQMRQVALNTPRSFSYWDLRAYQDSFPEWRQYVNKK